MKDKVLTQNLGYPRIGEKRELKKATEAYWRGKIEAVELKATGASIRKANWLKQKEMGIDLIPSNDFSFYDQMLDMSCLLGNVPPRFKWNGEMIDLDIRFLIARGKGQRADSLSTYACEMTKWFDTNYHYIVPEYNKDTAFKLSSEKLFDEFQEALELGIKTKPVIIGPLTYLILGKVQGKNSCDSDFIDLIKKLIPVYIEILKKLEAQGAEWVEIDEPVLALNLTSDQRLALKMIYDNITSGLTTLKIMVASYFGKLCDNLESFINLPVDALHIDAVRAFDELDTVLAAYPENKLLSLGVINGRNVWKNDFEHSLVLLEKARTVVGNERLIIAPSCSLLHSPITLRNEHDLDDEFKSWLSFAEEKLNEVTALARILDNQSDENYIASNRQSIFSRRESKRINNPAVKERCAAVTEDYLKRNSSFPVRQQAQHDKINLPIFPTTVIGSFPQTKEVRSMRTKHKKGQISTEDYETFLESEIKNVVEFQNEIDIDMPVHGEFERNDMVEYFGERLGGFTFTQNGWVQSYGSRYVKPPIIFGDVSRPTPMTTRWSSYAQSLTNKPMKGMLTGPITILQWSFVRDDQPRGETAKQIALAIRDEVNDLEKAGIAAIQIDEPALREGLPLRREDWHYYLDWSVKAFRLCSSGVRDDTQIHTHMCYSEFNDIIESIANLDADIISIETSRSNMELLDVFAKFNYHNEIGPGVYDIHSPRIPDVQEMDNLLQKAIEVLPKENIWVNPDCGLKTRQWEEVKPALKNMVLTAKAFRDKIISPATDK